ncbi:hypothetical protein [Desulfopila sp. IMCC35008]|uniref:hypothetical protein n=1 Tax=Desulfopila sp. IMCC35008 TaxID=2653858 RepID=UPI0013D20C2B|nr:hypothetical protein [Desulfopila sp. IMCC35008]
MKPFKWALLFYIFANIVYLLRELPAISYSNSSTAAIGYIFLPLASAFVCLPWLVVGGTFGYGIKARATRSRKHLIIAVVGGVLSLCYIGYASSGYMTNSRLTDTVKAIEQMNAAQLDSFVTSSDLRDNKFALGVVCLNQQASAETLAKIAAKRDPELYTKMWSSPEIMGGNRRGYAVMRLVVFHPNVTEEILTELAKKTEPYLLGDIAGNGKTPQVTLERIYQEIDNSGTSAYLIEWGLSHNVNAPTHILVALANSRNEYTLRNLENNTATPLNIRREVVSRIQRQDYD